MFTPKPPQSRKHACLPKGARSLGVRLALELVWRRSWLQTGRVHNQRADERSQAVAPGASIEATVRAGMLVLGGEKLSGCVLHLGGVMVLGDVLHPPLQQSEMACQRQDVVALKLWVRSSPGANLLEAAAGLVRRVAEIAACLELGQELHARIGLGGTALWLCLVRTPINGLSLHPVQQVSQRPADGFLTRVAPEAACYQLVPPIALNCCERPAGPGPPEAGSPIE